MLEVYFLNNKKFYFVEIKVNSAKFYMIVKYLMEFKHV